MNMLIFIILIIFAIMTIPIFKKMADIEEAENQKNKSKKTPLQSELEKYNDFKKYILLNNDIIILNSSINNVTSVTPIRNYYFEAKDFDYKNILEVSLIMDGETLTSTSRGSQLSGALVGGALLGGAGAIVGGLSGKQKSKQTVSQIYIKLTLISNENSIKKLIFLDLKYPINKTSNKFKNIYEEAMELEGKLKVIIHQNESNKKKVSSISVAEEVGKLHSLLIKGILTDEEFKIQKEKILSK